MELREKSIDCAYARGAFWHFLLVARKNYESGCLMPALWRVPVQQRCARDNAIALAVAINSMMRYLSAPTERHAGGCESLTSPEYRL